MKKTTTTAIAITFVVNTILNLQAQSDAQGRLSINFTKAEGYKDGPISSHRDWKAFYKNQEDAGTFTISESATAGILVVDPTDSGLQILTYQRKGKEIRSTEIHAEVTFTLQFQKGSTSVRSYRTSILPLFQLQNMVDKNKKMSFGIQHLAPLNKSPEDGNTFNLFLKNTYEDKNASSISERIDGKELGLEIEKGGSCKDGVSVELTLKYSIKYVPASGTRTETVTLLNASGSKVLAECTQTTGGDNADEFSKAEHLFRLSPQNMNEEEVAVHINSINFSKQKPLP